MPLPFIVEMTSKQHGHIKGSDTMYGKSHIILSYKFDHAVAIGMNGDYDRPDDTRIHEPVTIYKEVDCASPILHQHLVTGALLTDVALRFYAYDDLGREVNSFTIHLEKALITEISLKSHLAFLSENEPFRHMESVSISYQSIRWVDELKTREAEARTLLFNDSSNPYQTEGRAAKALIPPGIGTLTVMMIDKDSRETVPGVAVKVHHPDGLFTQIVSGSTGEITLKDVDEGSYVLASLEDKPHDAWRGNTLALLDVKHPSGGESDSFKPFSGEKPAGRNRADLTHLCSIKEYTVKKGDLFSGVAKANGFTFEDLAYFNWGTRDKSAFPGEQKMRFDTGDLAPSGDEYVLEGGTIYIPEPVKSTGIPTGLRHVAYVEKAGTRQVIHTIKTASGNPVPKVSATLVLGDGSKINALSDKDGTALFNGVPADLDGTVIYEDEDDLICRHTAADIHASAEKRDLEKMLYLLQRAVDFKTVKTVYKESYGSDPGKGIQESFKGNKEETAIYFFLEETGFIKSNAGEPSFDIRAYPDFACVTPTARVSYHAEPRDPAEPFPDGTKFQWKCVNDPATRPEFSLEVVKGPKTQHWKNAKWAFPGLHTLILQVTLPDGTTETAKHIQWVDTATHILGREFDPKDNDNEPGPFHVLAQKETELKVLNDIAKIMPPPPDKKEEHDKHIEALESYIGHLKHNLHGLAAKESLAVDAMYLYREQSQRIRLRLYLVNTTDKSENPSWTLVDWTNPMSDTTTGVYEGTGRTHTEAVEALLKKWDTGNRYPNGGLIAYDFKIPKRGVDLSGELETDGKTDADELSSWLDKIAIGSTVVLAVATLVLPIPGSRVVSAALWTSIFSSTASATINIAQRHAEGFGNWKDDAFDGLSIVGNLFAGAATWKLCSKVTSAVKIGAMTKGALIGQIGTDGLQGILLADEFVTQYQDVMDDQSLAPAERLSKIMEILRSAAIAAALTYVSVKGTKADINNLKKGSTRFTKAEVEHAATTINLDEKVASVPLKRGQKTVATIVETEPGRAAMHDGTQTKTHIPEPEKTTTPAVAKDADLNKNANNTLKNAENGHPVNAVTGAVVETVTDFAVPGRIPLVWERHYSSQSSSPGLLGPGWQCPADARLVLEDDGTAMFHHGSKSASVFPHLPEGKDAVPDVKSDVFLHEDDSHFIITDKNNITRRFRKRTGVDTFFLEIIRDSKGNSLLFRRDFTGLTRIEDSSGCKINVSSKDGRITRMVRVMPDGSETLLVRYEHDPKTSDLTAAFDVLNIPLTYEYENHCLTRLTLRSGQSFNYAYDTCDTQGKCHHTRGDDGLYDYTFDYNESENKTTITNSLGYLETISYDDGYRPVEAVDHTGQITRYTYNEKTRPEAVIDPLGRKTRYEYDHLSNLTRVTRPDGSTITMAYDANCNPVKITDPNGNIWQQAFEDRALLTSRTSPTGAETHYAYNNKGDLTSVTAANGGITRFSYDHAGQITAITHADGSTEQFERDTFGNITAAYDPLGRRTDYVYDEAFRLTKIIKPSGGVISCGYDHDGRLVRHTNEAGHVTRLSYTGMGKVKERINPDGTRVLYHYDTEERLQTLTNERGEIYEFRRDHAGRITNEIDYWGNERTYSYDPAGQLLQSIDPLNRITRFKTDALGRLIEKSFDDGKTETFSFDANGNLTAHENEHAKTERIFDNENRLIHESINGQTTAHEYDILGNRTRRVSALGNDIQFAYDILGRTNGISINGADMAIDRNALGLPVKETFFNGTERTYDYTADNQLAEQVVILPRGNTIERSYEYDPVGNLTARIDADKGSRYFTYNPMGRITKYTDPEQKIKEFLHDPAGDLFKRSEKEEFDGSWHLDHDGTDYHYNAAGNLIERKGKRCHHTFEWDENNRLASATNRESGTQTIMTYDAQGRRLSKTTGDQTTTFLWDGDQLLSDNIGGNNQREFVYYPGSFEPLAIIDENKTINLIHTDSVGLPQEVTNESGELVWSASYDAQGSVETFHAQDFDNPLRFAGQYYDPEIDLSYNRYRYFDAKVGSFVSQDPLGLAAGKNVYDYSPNVWGWVDPLGLSCSKTKKDPDYIYRTISPEDPHYKQYKNIGDVGYIEPKGGHNNLTMHVQEDKTNSIFTSWSKNKDSNWDLWAGDDYIQLQVDAKAMKNHAIDVSEWSFFPLEEEVTVIGKLINVTRVR